MRLAIGGAVWSPCARARNRARHGPWLAGELLHHATRGQSTLAPMLTLLFAHRPGRTAAGKLAQHHQRLKSWRQSHLSLIHISEPTRRTPISYAVFCLK